ncbi:MAG: ribonuclease III [Lachnospiraceae bacterium]|nr:ribonuclease III [Lachnospiraceae bacterium]MBP5184313.1 ribonuclease III [Lachnospiraceae bacterium]
MEEGLKGFLPVSDICSAFGMKAESPATYSPLTLAFIGDAVFDLVVRTLVVEHGNTQVNKLHRQKSAIVKAEAQKDLYFAIKDILTEEEEAVFKRGRNAKSYTTAKNASVSDYRIATGVEALVGYLYMSERYDRVLELLKTGFEALETLRVWSKE